MQGQKRKAMQRFRYRWVATTFQTWVSWTRVEVKNKLMADQGAPAINIADRSTALHARPWLGLRCGSCMCKGRR